MKILILGVNGFIGHHLSRRILETRPWEIYGMDMSSDRLENEVANPRFNFFEGDITINREWVEYHVKKCDIIVPLVAIATPSVYVSDPLSVFELDFEANLPIVRAAVRYGKRLIFPSSSEVYGMAETEEFNPDTTPLVYGPISKSRWIYACSKQLMDRIIHAYGEKDGLRYTLFRPFNWIGPRLDSIHDSKEGSSRVVTQFLGNIVRGENIQLVSGGHQRRCFTCVTDGVDALVRIIDNEGGVADRKIYNIGNPVNDHSVRNVAEMMISMALEYPAFSGAASQVRMATVQPEVMYGPGYQDLSRRVPNISNTVEDLEWHPCVNMDEALRSIFDEYQKDTASVEQLVCY